jgi:SAM-dependent methyltransferase
MDKICSICGGEEFVQHEVLWSELCKAWELSEYEIAYVNKQQGHCCIKCGSNMRSRVLASAIILAYSESGLFKDIISDSVFRNKRILEINKAGNLHQYLAKHPNHQLIEYPQFDMMQLDLLSEEFDLIIHSDTLEHIPDPLRAMRECHRILRKGGRCIYTIPVIVDRSTRSRTGLPDSYHGNPLEKAEDYLVHTEFGSDAWKMPLIAGFKKVAIHALDYPSALAFELIK